jgi:thiol:disulfide interchange protein DsbD
MAGAVGYALLQSTPAALSIFAALGFGLAFPYLALCFIPGLRQALPKPGAWMTVFRQLLAFPMFATAAWLLWVLGNQAGATGELYALMGMIALAFGIWTLKLGSGKTPVKLLAVLVILAGLSPIVLVKTENTQAPAAQQAISTDNWSAFSEAAYADALKSGRPVFTNMTASWCITCKVNERLALNTRETRALFAEKDVLYLKGDWTSRDETITKYLERYGRSGVPLYVYYGRPDPSTGERPEPVVLPQILTPGLVRDAL